MKIQAKFGIVYVIGGGFDAVAHNSIAEYNTNGVAFAAGADMQTKPLYTLTFDLFDHSLEKAIS